MTCLDHLPAFPASPSNTSSPVLLSLLSSWVGKEQYRQQGALLALAGGSHTWALLTFLRFLTVSRGQDPALGGGGLSWSLRSLGSQSALLQVGGRVQGQGLPGPGPRSSRSCPPPPVRSQSEAERCLARGLGRPFSEGPSSCSVHILPASSLRGSQECDRAFLLSSF